MLKILYGHVLVNCAESRNNLFLQLNAQHLLLFLKEIMVGSKYQAKIPPLGSYIYQERGKKLQGSTSPWHFCSSLSLHSSRLLLWRPVAVEAWCPARKRSGRVPALRAETVWPAGCGRHTNTRGRCTGQWTGTEAIREIKPVWVAVRWCQQVS